MKRYSISKISNIVGITPEAIRLYEKKGIVHSIKNVDTGYRYFHTLDIGTLLRSRTYTQLGFSLAEAASLINISDVKDISISFDRKCIQMKNELKYKLRVLNRIEDLTTQIKNCESDVGAYRIENHPGLFHLAYRHNEQLIETDDRIALYPLWSSWVPLSFVSLSFSLVSLLEGTIDYYCGFGVFSEDAFALGISESDIVRCFPSHKSVRTVLRIQGEREICFNDIQPSLDFIRSSHFKVAADPFTRMIVTARRNANNFVRYYEIWFPIDGDI